jgi:chromosome segregation ATPase
MSDDRIRKMFRLAKTARVQADSAELNRLRVTNTQIRDERHLAMSELSKASAELARLRAEVERLKGALLQIERRDLVKEPTENGYRVCAGVFGTIARAALSAGEPGR